MPINKRKHYVSGRFAYDKNMGKVRLSNEDQAYACINAFGTVLLIVCDGMGGENKGDLASNIALSYISDAFRGVNKFYSKLHVYYWLNKTIKKANAEIYNEASRNKAYSGMGTTLSIAIIYHDFLLTAQIGDSRIYEMKESNLNQITVDQTYVGYLYRTGQISKEQMATHPKRHMLMNALGIYPTVNVDFKIKKYENQSLLLCTDGLYNNVSETTIASVIRGNDTPEQKVNELISLSNANGGSDNIAVVVWENTSYAN